MIPYKYSQSYSSKTNNYSRVWTEVRAQVEKILPDYFESFGLLLILLKILLHPVKLNPSLCQWTKHYSQNLWTTSLKQVDGHTLPHAQLTQGRNLDTCCTACAFSSDDLASSYERGLLWSWNLEKSEFKLSSQYLNSFQTSHYKHLWSI